MRDVVMTTGSIRHGKLQSNRHHQQTHTKLFTGRVLFLLPSSVNAHTLSIHFKGHFPGEPGLAPVLLKLRMVEVVVTTGDISRAKLQSNHRNQQTKT